MYKQRKGVKHNWNCVTVSSLVCYIFDSTSYSFQPVHRLYNVAFLVAVALTCAGRI